ncbi:hypothetical protein FB565_007466 [Actinoplanes lutulentus]|uniref:Uncharacterized protein n=1 Tax=Actinoplanes lutulentus TaxID=1287878 RepID=A0A327Z0S0_9ACTN|nr:hypothetical protein [Actinoplanes lutulentus]MBB2947695.1 hypothetical protein [Actinoplanes lutulentus]RAK27751.1 hypothetical protein B0I29_122134 [Actinoplanes lutulentus]
MAGNDTFHAVREPGFTALFLLGGDDLLETVDDVDAEVRLPDGTRWSASFLTLSAIERVMTRWRQTGESGSGAFFQCSDLVIVPEPGVPAMVEALRAIMKKGPEGTLGRLD